MCHTGVEAVAPNSGLIWSFWPPMPEKHNNLMDIIYNIFNIHKMCCHANQKLEQHLIPNTTHKGVPLPQKFVCLFHMMVSTNVHKLTYCVLKCTQTYKSVPLHHILHVQQLTRVYLSSTYCMHKCTQAHKSLIPFLHIL